MKGVHPHIWKFLCIFLVTAVLTSILFRFAGKKQPSIPDQHTRQPVVCIAEDDRDTAFKKAVKENETLYLPSKSTLVTLTREEMAMFYHRYINNIQYFCKSKLRLGKVGNGGWDVCDEAQYRPKKPCLVYSFGVGDDFSFDDGVIEKYGCEVHSFDTRMGTKSYQRKNSDYFHAFGVAATKKINDDGTELLTYTSILQKLEHSERKISLLKLAIESLEWEVLDSMLTSGQLSDTNNLAVEFHLERSSSETDGNTYTQALLVLKKLYDAGYGDVVNRYRQQFVHHLNVTETYSANTGSTHRYQVLIGPLTVELAAFEHLKYPYRFTVSLRKDLRFYDLFNRLQSYMYMYPVDGRVMMIGCGLWNPVYD